MAATALTDRYAANLHGVLSCYDRIIVTGTLPGACYAGGMTSFLYSRGIRIFDNARFAEPLRERIRQRAREVCTSAGVEIGLVRKIHIHKSCIRESRIRKEDLVACVLAARGDAPGLVVSWPRHPGDAARHAVAPGGAGRRRAARGRLPGQEDHAHADAGD